jgi:O-antigen/teichoic acid export membrane protein
MKSSLNPYARASVFTGIFAFFAGRGSSALLTFASFALVSRILDVPSYGFYATSLALMELGLALSTAGIDWVATRSVPEYRLHAGGAATVKFVCQLSAMQALILICVGGLVASIATPLAKALQLPLAATPFMLVGLLLTIEGIGRLCRDQMLGILMFQRSAQVAQLFRSGTLAVQLAWTLHSGSKQGVDDILFYEIIASASAAIVGVALLAYALLRLWPLKASNVEWHAPSRKQLWALALNTYASYLLTLSYGPQILTMLIARVLGVEAAGTFGFARGFADQVRRYLPTDLLQSIFRPALVAYYSSEQNFPGLALRLGLWLKSSLLVLLPLIAFFSVFGELGAAALSGGRFISAWPVILTLLCGTGMMAWRRVAELACNTIMQPQICVNAGLLLLLVAPLMIAVLYVTNNLLSAVVLIVTAEASFCIRVVYILRKRGFPFSWSLTTYIKILCALLITVIPLLLLRAAYSPSLVSAACATCAMSILAVYIFKPLCSSEKEIVASWSPRLARLMHFSIMVSR